MKQYRETSELDEQNPRRRTKRGVIVQVLSSANNAFCWSFDLSSASWIADRKIAFRTVDIEEARAYLSRVFVPHRLTSPGQIFFSHRSCGLPGLSLNLLRYGGEVEVIAPPMGSFYLLQYGVSGRCAINNEGAAGDSSAGKLFVVNATKNLRMNWSSDCQQLVFKIDRSIVERELADSLQSSVSKPVEFGGLSAGPGCSFSGSAIVTMLHALCAVGDCPGDSFSKRSMRAVQRAFAALMLDAFPHNYSEDLRRANSDVAPWFVKCAEEYMRAHSLEVISMVDVAAAVGVSVRSINYGFKRFRGTTPMAVHKRMRLELARRMLIEADVSVARVAKSFGFQHLGKFSRSFREQFGLNPSDVFRGQQPISDYPPPIFEAAGIEL